MTKANKNNNDGTCNCMMLEIKSTALSAWEELAKERMTVDEYYEACEKVDDVVDAHLNQLILNFLEKKEREKKNA